jgi:hypothetical protein
MSGRRLTIPKFEVFVGCLELQSMGVTFFPSKTLAWRRSTYSFNVALGVDTPRYLHDILISSTFGSCS